MSVITLGGDFIHYEVLGRGRPLIFLHSWIGSWRYWVPAMQATSTNYRSYAVDFWGFGDTSKHPAMYTLESQKKLVYEFIEYMGLGKIALVGHGLGAIVAVKFAIDFPDLVDRLLLCSLPAEVPGINSRLLTNSLPELVDWIVNRHTGVELVRSEALKADLAAIRSSLSILHEVDAGVGRNFQKLKTPSVFVFGQNDPVVPIPSDDTFERIPGNTHWIIFEQSGHFPMLDESNKFNRLMSDLLALGAGESPQKLQVKAEWRRRIR